MRPETRDFLRRVRDAEDPSPADERRVLRGLRATLDVGGGPRLAGLGEAAPPQGAPGSRRASWLGRSWAAPKVTLGVAIACASGAALGALELARTDAHERPPRAPHASQAPAAATPPRLEPKADPTAAPPPGPEPPPQPPRPAEPKRQAHPRRAAQPAPETRSPPEASPDPAARRSSSLGAELALLERVQRALQRGDGEAALRALDAHATSDRVLLAERRAARILALCSLGRVQAAQQAAADFARQHPGSVQSAAIASSCANASRKRER